MDRYPNDYITTGNNIPLREDYLIKQVIQELTRYDNLVAATGKTSNYSPYTHPIIITTEDGKQVQVPENIQIKAINIWKYKNNPEQMINNDYGNAKREYEELQETPYGHANDEQIEQSVIPSNDEEEIIVVHKEDNTFLYIIIAVIVIGMLYYMHTNGKLKL